MIQLLMPLQQAEASLWSQQFPALAFELVRRQSGFYGNNVHKFERQLTTSKDSTLSKEALAIFCKHPNFNAVHGGWGAEGVGRWRVEEDFLFQTSLLSKPTHFLSCLDFEIQSQAIWKSLLRRNVYYAALSFAGFSRSRLITNICIFTSEKRY